MRKLFLNLLFSMIITVFVIPSIATFGFAEQKSYRFRMQVPLPASLLTLYDPFVDTLKKASNGRINVKVYSGGELVPIPDMLHAVSKNAIEMAVIMDGYYDVLQTSSMSNGFPMGWKDFDEALNICETADDEKINQILREDYKASGVYFLGNEWADQITILSKKPITNIGDFKGLKIECSSPLWSKWLQKLGAVPQMIPSEEIYTALATGIIDGTMWGAAGSYEAVGFTEVAKYYHKPYPIAAYRASYVINIETWNSLPEDLKEILMLSLRNLSLNVHKTLINGEIASRKKLKIVEWDHETTTKMREISYEVLSEETKRGPLAEQYIKMVEKNLD